MVDTVKVEAQLMDALLRAEAAERKVARSPFLYLIVAIMAFGLGAWLG